MLRFTKMLGLLGVIAAASFAAEPHPLTEASLREMFDVPADGKLLYQDQNGATISFETMTKLMQAGKPASMIKNPAKHEYTFTLKAPKEPPPAPKLTRLPPFSLAGLDRNRVRSADLAGKPTLISFFFSTCVPCIKEVPILNAFRKKHPGYNYLAITFDPKDEAAQFVKERHLEWPVAVDAMTYLEATGIRGFPTYLYVSATGDVLGQDSGLSTESMKDQVAGLREFEQWVDESKQGAGATGGWHPLLDADLSQFDVYLSYRGDQIQSVLKGTAPAGLEPIGFNPPSQNIFSMVQKDGAPALRISGEIYGCLVTKESFSNYHFRARTKWGGKKWPPRLDESRDSGILYHSNGEFGVDYWQSWALSQEFQVIEHGLGEYWRQATSAFDIRVGPKEPSPDRSPDAPRWNPQSPWVAFDGANNHALAGSDQDKPGEWNQLELICYADKCVHVVNGKVVMALANSRYRDGDEMKPLTGGKLQIQSEAAEVFYKDLEIRSIPAMPPEYAGYFK